MSSTVVDLKRLDTGAVVRCGQLTPFLVGAPCKLVPDAGAAATVYRVAHPGTADRTRYARFVLNGATTSLTMPSSPVVLNPLEHSATVPILDEFDVQIGTQGLLDSLRLQTVVLVNGVPIVRLCSDEVPAAGQCACTGATTLVLGSTYANGTVVEVFAYLVADLSDTGSLAAQSQTIEVCSTFYTATAKVTLKPSGK